MIGGEVEKSVIAPHKIHTAHCGFSTGTAEMHCIIGSYAFGEPDQDSDIDMFIIKETDERPMLLRRISFDRWVNVCRIVSDRTRRIPFEPLVITQKELEERIKRGDQFIAASQDFIAASQDFIAASQDFIAASQDFISLHFGDINKGRSAL
jgi:hypothetical protein